MDIIVNENYSGIPAKGGFYAKNYGEKASARSQ
jgi:hypothetical protein